MVSPTSSYKLTYVMNNSFLPAINLYRAISGSLGDLHRFQSVGKAAS